MQPAQLKELRQRHGLSIAQAARRVGIDSSYWGKLERGTRPLTQKLQNAIQDRFMANQAQIPFKTSEPTATELQALHLELARLVGLRSQSLESELQQVKQALHDLQKSLPAQPALKPSDYQALEQLRQLQVQAHRSQATQRRKLQDRIIQIASQYTHRLYPKGFSPEQLRTQIRDLQRLVSSTVADFHGTNTWARSDYDEADFRLAYELLSQFCQKHRLQAAPNLTLLTGGLAQ